MYKSQILKYMFAKYGSIWIFSAKGNENWYSLQFGSSHLCSEWLSELIRVKVWMVSYDKWDHDQLIVLPVCYKHPPPGQLLQHSSTGSTHQDSFLNNVTLSDRLCKLQTFYSSSPTSPTLLDKYLFSHMQSQLLPLYTTTTILLHCLFPYPTSINPFM